MASKKSLTADDIDAIEALLAGDVSPAPWFVIPERVVDGVREGYPSTDTICHGDEHDRREAWHVAALDNNNLHYGDAALIAGAVNALPALIALARRGLEASSAAPLYEVEALMRRYTEASGGLDKATGIDCDDDTAEARHAAGLKAVAAMAEAKARECWFGQEAREDLRNARIEATAERERADAAEAERDDWKARAETAVDKAGAVVKDACDRADAAETARDVTIDNCDGDIAWYEDKIARVEACASAWKRLAKRLRAGVTELEGKAARALEKLGPLGRDDLGRPLPLVEAAMYAVTHADDIRKEGEVAQ